MKKKPDQPVTPLKVRTGPSALTPGQNKLNSNSKHQQTEKKIAAKTLTTPLNST
jgi:hypothetical protein